MYRSLTTFSGLTQQTTCIIEQQQTTFDFEATCKRFALAVCLLRTINFAFRVSTLCKKHLHWPCRSKTSTLTSARPPWRSRSRRKGFRFSADPRVRRSVEADEWSIDSWLPPSNSHSRMELLAASFVANLQPFRCRCWARPWITGLFTHFLDRTSLRPPTYSANEPSSSPSYKSASTSDWGDTRTMLPVIRTITTLLQTKRHGSDRQSSTKERLVMLVGIKALPLRLPRLSMTRKRHGCPNFPPKPSSSRNLDWIILWRWKWTYSLSTTTRLRFERKSRSLRIMSLERRGSKLA